MTFERAKIDILSSLLAFPTINQKDWETCYIDNAPIVGDLVSLCSAPPSKWYLSWVMEIEVADSSFCTRYLLKSIDDGSLCWWSNVAFNIYSRKKVLENQTWKWNDKQFAFKKRWMKVCYKQNDAYIVLPIHPIFGEDDTVTLGVRVRHQFNKYTSKKTFPNWKKCTMKMMDKYYKQCEKEEAVYKSENGSDGL